jgi:outer membrane protein OmpA-like peptidoglycan-associated protein
LGFLLYRGASCASYVSNIKITTASPDTRNKLLTEGKLVTYGIYFDVNKDVVKPESYGTLNDIAKILNEVPDVKVKIVGHTDSDGDDAMNLDLSKRRAASVKAELAKSFGVNADRLFTDGMGESQPVAPNDKPVNKALNRRVEFIKQ